MSKLVPRVLKGVKFSNVNYKRRNSQLEGKHLMTYRITCTSYILFVSGFFFSQIQSYKLGLSHQKANSLLEEGEVDPQRVTTFYSGVRAFFERAVEYGLQNLPLDDVNARFIILSRGCKLMYYKQSTW